MDKGLGMDDAIEDDFAEDIGLSVEDVKAIKNTMLNAFLAGKLTPEHIQLTASQFIGAFTDLDNEAILRDDMTKRLTQTGK